MAPATAPSESPGGERPYHHGQLAEALLDAAIDRARSGGPGAIGLREVTRAVGVTPRAAYRHYADRDALVLAVARVALARMSAEMRRRLEAVPAPGEEPDAAALHAARRLEAVGAGYVAAALAEPGLFETAMFGLDDMVESRSRDGEPPTPYEELLGAIGELVAAGRVRGGDAEVVAATCWSTVHGFSALATQGPMRELAPEAALGLGLRVVRQVTSAVTGVELAA